MGGRWSCPENKCDNTEYKVEALKKSNDPNSNIGVQIKDKNGEPTTCSRFHYNIQNDIENAKYGSSSKTYQSHTFLNHIKNNDKNIKTGITNYNSNMTSYKCYNKIPNRKYNMFCPCSKKPDESYTLEECGDDCPKFSEWSECTKKCGGGTQTRTCSDGVTGENSQCVGDFTRECNTHDCSIDCSVSPWSDWSNCEPCNYYNVNESNNGTQTRTRTVLVEPLNDSKSCPELKETKSCTISKDCYKNRYKTLYSQEQSNKIDNHLNNIRNFI